MKRLELLDYTRFIAVIMVVLFHYTFNGIVNGKIGSISHSPWLIEITKYGYLSQLMAVAKDEVARRNANDEHSAISRNLGQG